MKRQVSHDYDPKCPYCLGSLEDLVEDRQRQREEKARPLNTGKIPRTDRAIFEPVDDGKEQIPKWVNPSIQRPSLRKQLIQRSKTTPR